MCPNVAVGNFTPQTFFFNEKAYELENPHDYLMNILTYPKYPDKHVDLVTIVLVGGMGSGKSTAIKYITNILYKIYKSELHAFRTTDLVYALTHGVELGFTQLVIFDDAMQAGFDSRRSMSSENLSMSENFAIGRHLVEKQIKRGILFVIFAIQSPTRLDKFIMQNANLRIFKSYYDELVKLAPPDEVDYVKDFTEDGMNKHNFEARCSCLAITNTKRFIRFHFPDEDPLIDVPFIHPEKTDLIPLQQGLMKNFELASVSDKVLKGFVMDYCEQTKSKFTNKEIMETIYRGSYDQFKEGVQKAKEEAEKAKELENTLIDFEPECVNVLTSKFDLANEDKGVVKGYFIQYCRDHRINYSKLDYNAISLLALYQQKKQNAEKQITDPDELSLEILKFRHYIANKMLGMKLDKIAEIEGITAQGVQYRKKQEEILLKKILGK